MIHLSHEELRREAEERVVAIRARLNAVHCSWILEYVPNWQDRSILSSDVMSMSAERKAFGDLISNALDDLRFFCNAITPAAPPPPRTYHTYEV